MPALRVFARCEVHDAIEAPYDSFTRADGSSGPAGTAYRAVLIDSDRNKFELRCQRDDFLAFRALKGTTADLVLDHVSAERGRAFLRVVSVAQVAERKAS